MRVAVVGLVVCLLALAAAEVPVWTKCSESSDAVCNISEIRVVPCKNPSVCKLKKGKQASIDIDYTPNFSADNVKTGLYWPSPSGDLAFAELNNANACEYTACPLQPGAQKNFHYGLYIGKKLPTGIFALKWKLWKEGDTSQVCCFQMNVRLEK